MKGAKYGVQKKAFKKYSKHNKFELQLLCIPSLYVLNYEFSTAINVSTL